MPKCYNKTLLIVRDANGCFSYTENLLNKPIFESSVNKEEKKIEASYAKSFITMNSGLNANAIRKKRSVLKYPPLEINKLIKEEINNEEEFISKKKVKKNINIKEIDHGNIQEDFKFGQTHSAFLRS